MPLFALDGFYTNGSEYSSPLLFIGASILCAYLTAFLAVLLVYLLLRPRQQKKG